MTTPACTVRSAAALDAVVWAMECPSNAVRVRAENFKRAALRLEAFERRLHIFLRLVTEKIDKENIFPRLLLRRSRFYFRQIHTGRAEWLQNIVERAHAIFDRKQNRCLVFSSRCG